MEALLVLDDAPKLNPKLDVVPVVTAFLPSELAPAPNVEPRDAAVFVDDAEGSEGLDLTEPEPEDEGTPNAVGNGGRCGCNPIPDDLRDDAETNRRAVVEGDFNPTPSEEARLLEAVVDRAASPTGLAGREDREGAGGESTPLAFAGGVGKVGWLLGVGIPANAARLDTSALAAST